MACDGFTEIPRSDLGAFGNQGFGNVLIKRNASGNITDVVINESKQIPNGSVQLNNRIQGTGNSDCSVCTHITDAWVVLMKLIQALEPLIWVLEIILPLEVLHNHRATCLQQLI